MENYPGSTVLLLWFYSGTPDPIALRPWSKKAAKSDPRLRLKVDPSAQVRRAATRAIDQEKFQ
jgi:hypothetical protein